MTQHSVEAALHHVLSACEQVGDFTAGVTFEEYQGNLLLQAGVERYRITIGEALHRAKRLDPNLESDISHVEAIIGFRNVLVHGYDVVDPERVWNIVTRFVPVLQSELRERLGNIPCQESL